MLRSLGTGVGLCVLCGWVFRGFFFRCKVGGYGILMVVESVGFYLSYVVGTSEVM